MWSHYASVQLHECVFVHIVKGTSHNSHDGVGFCGLCVYLLLEWEFIIDDYSDVLF